MLHILAVEKSALVACLILYKRYPDFWQKSLEGIGIDAFNPTFKQDIAAMRRKLGPKVCIIGNIPPMALARETPERVAEITRDTIDEYVKENGSIRGLLLSTGGGAPMGARRENIEAMIETAKNYR